MATPLRAPISLANLCHVDEYRRSSGDAIDLIELSREERLLPPAPRFMFGPVPQHVSWQLFGEFAIAATGCYAIRNGRITSDGIALHGDTALWSAAFNHPDYYVRNVVDGTGLNRGALPIRHVSGQAAVIFGPGYPVYGHWLVDFLPRIQILQEAGFDIESLMFVLPRDLPPFGFEFMRLIGIPEAHIVRHAHDDEQLQFDCLLLPTILRTASRLHPNFAAASRTWIERVAGPRQGAKGTRRLFVSRAGVQSGRILRNRQEVETIAADKGYEVVLPEALTLQEQIMLFRSARLVVGEYGSAMHSTIFGAPNLSMMVLRGTSVAPGFVQSSLAAACWQSIGYAFGASDAHTVNYTFEVDARDVRLGLAALELMPS